MARECTAQETPDERLRRALREAEGQIAQLTADLAAAKAATASAESLAAQRAREAADAARDKEAALGRAGVAERDLRCLSALDLPGHVERLSALTKGLKGLRPGGLVCPLSDEERWKARLKSGLTFQPKEKRSGGGGSGIRATQPISWPVHACQ